MAYEEVCYLKNYAANANNALRCSIIDNLYNSDDHSYRNAFMRDRDRILYCKSFLRLSGKTQVYAPSKSDHQRTRLTHTLEVSQIARTIAKSLDLDLDLTEAIALGHDIGHTPFGHAGERMLHEIMSPSNDIDSQIPKSTSIYKLTSNDSKEAYKKLYGFKHNLQSVRATIEDLETRSSENGLDLCNYTLWGMAHHSSIKYKAGKVATDYLEPLFYQKYSRYWKKADGSDAWSFEAFVVAEADEIAQMHHDLEDAIRSKSISYESVFNLVGMIEDLMDDNDKEIFKALQQDPRSKEFFIAVVSKVVVNTLVTHLINASKKNFEAISIKDIIPQNIHSLNTDLIENEFIKKTIGYDVFDNDCVTKKINDFKYSLSKAVLYSNDVQRTDSKGRYIIKNLFEAYYTNPQQLPDTALKNLYKSLSIEGYKFEIKDKYYKIDSSKLRYALTQAISEIRGKRNIEMDICIMRIICDYIAGMTDNFAINEYEKLYG